MSFEKFSPSTKKNRPLASISTLARLSLNEACVDSFGLEGLNFAELFYDSAEKLIGIRFQATQGNDALRVQRRKNSGLFFNMKSFFHVYRIDYSKTYFCLVRQDAEDKKFIIVDLKVKSTRRAYDVTE